MELVVEEGHYKYQLLPCDQLKRNENCHYAYCFVMNILVFISRFPLFYSSFPLLFYIRYIGGA